LIAEDRLVIAEYRTPLPPPVPASLHNPEAPHPRRAITALDFLEDERERDYLEDAVAPHPALLGGGVD